MSHLTTYPPSRQRLQIGPNAHWLDSVWKRQAHFATIVEHLPWIWMNCLKIQQHIVTYPNYYFKTKRISPYKQKIRTFQIQLSKCLQSPCLERVWQTFQLNDSRAFGMKFASNGNAMPRSVNFKLCQASCSNKNGETLSFTTYVKWKHLSFQNPCPMAAAYDEVNT